MNAIPPGFGSGPPDGAPGNSGARADSLDRRWAALIRAGEALAALAGRDPATLMPERLPRQLRSPGGWRRLLIDQGIEDLVVVMDPGLTAILEAHARGADVSGAAAALWDEFAAAHSALMALVAPSPAQDNAA